MQTHDAVVELARPLYPVFVEAAKAAHEDLRNWVPAEEASTLRSQTRASVMHDRLVYHLQKRFLGNVEVQVITSPSGFKYLFVQGPAFCLGIRPKKVGKDYHSYNSHTDTQDGLRSSGVFLWHEMETVQLFLGYTEGANELDATLNRVLLTKEVDDRVEWADVLWQDSNDDSLGIASEPMLPLEPMGGGVTIRVKESAAWQQEENRG